MCWFHSSWHFGKKFTWNGKTMWLEGIKIFISNTRSAHSNVSFSRNVALVTFRASFFSFRESQQNVVESVCHSLILQQNIRQQTLFVVQFIKLFPNTYRARFLEFFSFSPLPRIIRPNCNSENGAGAVEVV